MSTGRSGAPKIGRWVSEIGAEFLAGLSLAAPESITEATMEIVPHAVEVTVKASEALVHDGYTGKGK